MDQVKPTIQRSLITNEWLHVVNISGFVKYFKSQSSMYRYFKTRGFEFVTEGDLAGYWLKTKYSKDEVWLNQKFSRP